MARSARHSSLETRTARARLKVRRTPYFAKIAKGLRLGYYRGANSGSWVASFYCGAKGYVTKAIGAADDTVDANGATVFDFWQAQDQSRTWAERQRLVVAGIVRNGPYTIKDAVEDYLSGTAAEKKPAAVKGAKYVFDAWILPELGSLKIDEVTTEKLVRWRNKIATAPKRVRTKRGAAEQATHETADDDDARRGRKATANRILTMLKAALNRAFYADRVASDSAWRKVKPFKNVDGPIVRYLNLREARRLVDVCPQDFRKLIEAALYTGCRYAELGRLKYEDYNNDSGTLSVRLSKGKNRHVFLTEEGKQAFRQWTANLEAGKRIFLRRDGKPWGTSHQQRPLDEASDLAGIAPAVNFHILRHTHASYLAMAGVPMAVIAKQLGHADTRMTEKHYAHLAPSYVAQTIRENFPVLGLSAFGQVAQFRSRAATQPKTPASRT
ncbi:tyrosine-type recombinase/integrase [Bradyrhizobium sp. 26S5]|uniref:tyrosine-type recombinase/integrase n=1 Tax=Bradyrhizobium sp. 26S5 TaxID=3139729 RepID=UPI0030D2C485